MNPKFATAPFPYFGGKRQIAARIWERLGKPKQYLEPFCGSAAMLLAAPFAAPLEVIGDTNCFVANFWRAVKWQPGAVAQWADYPVSHRDLAARHRWLMAPPRTAELEQGLDDADWPGDAKIAGWWVWGQCAWIGSGWCERELAADVGQGVQSKIPHVSSAGQGVQSQIPHVSSAGQGVQSQIPHVSSAGQGVQAWLLAISERLARVRILHGAWERCLNHHYGGANTVVFLDPPYKSYEHLYAKNSQGTVAEAVAQWAAANAELRIALCGLAGDYDLPAWSTMAWQRDRGTYGSAVTRAAECVWFSPACLPPREPELFAAPTPLRQLAQISAD